MSSISDLMKAANESKAPRRLLSLLTSAERKEYPMTTGLLDYFPDALAMVSHVSFKANQKHNPGQPMHWSRAKSSDHQDCEVRHMIERGGKDPEGLRHSAEKAWRALADLQHELEAEFKLDPPRAAMDNPICVGLDLGKQPVAYERPKEELIWDPRRREHVEKKRDLSGL